MSAIQDFVREEQQRLKGNWAENKVAGMLGDCERTMRAHIEQKLSPALGRVFRDQDTDAMLTLTMPPVQAAIDTAITTSPEQGIPVAPGPRTVLPTTKAASDVFEAAIAGRPDSEKGAIRDVVMAGLEEAHRSLTRAMADARTGGKGEQLLTR